MNKKQISFEEAKQIGNLLGVTWDKFDIDQFKLGMETELEHGTVNLLTNITNDDLVTTGKIALAHLNELPDYYTRMQIMEEQGKAGL